MSTTERALRTKGTEVSDAMDTPPSLLHLARDVFTQLDEGDGEAPGHCHSRRGIWDDDNGAKAGTTCQWCALWNQFGECLASLPPAPAKE